MIKEIMSYLIPVVSVGLSFCLGWVQSSRSFKKEQLQKQFDGLYSPMIERIYKYDLLNKRLIELSCEQREDIYSLLLSNVKYMSNEMFIFLPNFCADYPFIEEHMESQQGAETMFHYLILHLLSRSTQLSNKLKLPPVGTVAAGLWNLRFEKLKQRLEKVEQ